MWPALSTQHSALSTQHSALSTQHLALGTWHSALGTWQLTLTALLLVCNVPIAFATTVQIPPTFKWPHNTLLYDSPQEVCNSEYKYWPSVTTIYESLDTTSKYTQFNGTTQTIPSDVTYIASGTNFGRCIPTVTDLWAATGGNGTIALINKLNSYSQSAGAY